AEPPRWGDGLPAIRTRALGLVWPDNVEKTGVRSIGQPGFPVVASVPEQVERTRRKTWSRGRSEVFVPYRHAAAAANRLHLHPRVTSLGRDRVAPILPQGGASV